jgi:NAD(P)H dehydrogenase (quinone)
MKMRVYIVFAHPSRDSFTWQVLQAFTRGLEAGGHEYEVGDLYEMGFQADMDLEHYKRETGGDPEAPVPDDVRLEQEKLGRADALALIFPLWWSDCPAKLKGWFDRVFTYGFAYVYADSDDDDADGGVTHITSRLDLGKAVVICPAGHPGEHLEEIGIAESMRKIMIGDRLLGVGVREATLEILGGQSLGDDSIRERNLKRAYELGRGL